MKILVTGITGFVGSHLSEYLLSKKGIQVHGIERWRSKEDNIQHIKEKIRLHYCDIRDASSVYDVIRKVKPDRIFHLAAQSFVPSSWTAPAETLTTNIVGELNIFEAVRELKLNPLIHIAGSSEEYGLIGKRELPIKETNPLRPLSPYGVSKVAQDLLGYQYYQSYGLPIVRTRAFNHTGPRRGEVFMTSNFAKQIAMIERGKQKSVLWVGNLTPRRDFTDVRDVVRAYWLALEKGKKGDVYNICSGKDYSAGEVLKVLLSLSRVKPKIKRDPQRMRPSDVMRLLGDSTKFRRLTGWKPEIPFRKTMEDLLNYWRERV